MLLLRPGKGAWTLTTGDGRATDESPASDGWVFTAPDAMAPIGEAGEAPEAFEAGDLMEYFALRIVR